MLVLYKKKTFFTILEVSNVYSLLQAGKVQGMRHLPRSVNEWPAKIYLTLFFYFTAYLSESFII